jgi:hypothetical protein
MRIDSLSPAHQIATTTPISTLKPGSKRQTEDRVDISDMAAELSTDPQKLGQIAASYAAGTYRVVPNQVASSIIQQMLGS